MAQLCPTSVDGIHNSICAKMLIFHAQIKMLIKNLFKIGIIVNFIKIQGQYEIIYRQ